MNRLLGIIERFAPEAVEMMENRYQILRQILYQQPVGRRQLGKTVGCSERLVRSEVDLLKAKGALISTPAGIYITSYGEEMLREVDEIIPCLFKLQSLSEQLKRRFDLDEVIIVPGDSYLSNYTREDLGRAAAEYLRRILFPGCILAVTGGSTLAGMARSMRPGVNCADICVLPARGGLGENVETQAGSIAARIADTIGAQYRLLHIPDNLEESTAKALQKDIHITRVVEKIKSADILVHGIGPALEMAEKRGLSADEIKFLQENEGMGEALRYYFDRWGKIIFEIPGIGLETSDLKNIKNIVAVAGGSNKAEAIKAVLQHKQESVLITDEGVAQNIINGKDEHNDSENWD
ncbi:MAG: sugar-binding domain-containing protein [Bacillota bacterium]|nr:sugar-binding domain-containing protein [Bacillota bacterium]